VSDGEILFGRGSDWYRRSTPWTRDRTLMEMIVKQIAEHAPDGLCVEVGAGGCDIAISASASGAGPWMCIDKSHSMLATASGFTGYKVQADASSLPLGDGAASLVACRSVLHYVGAKSGLKEWRRVLTQGGSIVVAQKVADRLRKDIEWYQKVQSLRSVAPREWYFTEDLISLAKDAGLGVAKTMIYSGHYEVPFEDWVSRRGALAGDVTAELRSLAQLGRDPAFSSRTGFTLNADKLGMTFTWSVLTFVVM
jgi:SAM-dependent methyltransferase